MNTQNNFPTPEEIAKKIRQIDPAFSVFVDGGFIEGCYRGKSSQSYKYDIVNRKCVYDNAGFAHIIAKIYE